MDPLELIRDWLSDFGQNFGVEQAVAIASAVVALVSFVLNMRVVNRQARMQAADLRLAHDGDVIRWSDEVITLLAEAEEMLGEKGSGYAETEFRSRRSAARARLSALIDRGRLFFPNRTDTDHGKDKEESHRGHRQPALEALVKAYDELGKAGALPGPDSEGRERLYQLRRTFVAEVFKAIDPVRRGATLRELGT